MDLQSRAHDSIKTVASKRIIWASQGRELSSEDDGYLELHGVNEAQMTFIASYYEDVLRNLNIKLETKKAILTVPHDSVPSWKTCQLIL